MGRRLLQRLYDFEVARQRFGWWFGWMGDREVYEHPAQSVALMRIARYTGVWGDIVSGRTLNPLRLTSAWLHNGLSLNARAVRERTEWAARQLAQDRPAMVADFAAGAADACWRAMKSLGEKFPVVGFDWDPYMIADVRKAAAHYGFRDVVHPAYVFAHIGGSALGRLKDKVVSRIGLPKEQVCHQNLLGQGASLGQILREAPPGFTPVVANVFRLPDDGWKVPCALSLGFLDYLEPSEIIRALGMIRGFMENGATLLTAHMRPNPEFEWVRMLPWRRAEENGLHLKPKETADFLGLLSESGFTDLEHVVERNGIYTLVRARVP